MTGLSDGILVGMVIVAVLSIPMWVWIIGNSLVRGVERILSNGGRG